MKYPYQFEIQKAAEEFGLNPDHVAAHCCIESSFRPAAIRFEAAFQKKYIDDNPKYKKEPESTRILLATSIGLMQIMGVVAHEYGLPMFDLYRLEEADTGLRYGCKHLKHYLDKYKTLENAVAAYNAGSPRKTVDGKYVNQDYVNKVLKKYTQYKEV